MPTNFYMYFVVALIPLIVGFVYYHPKVLGSAWMKTNNFTEEDLKGSNMAVIFGLSYVFGILIAMALTGVVIHQAGVFSLLAPAVMESGSAAQNVFNDLMQTYGGNYRTFGHGAFHGVILSLFLVLPIIGTNALFERKGWKYIFIHLGYWLLCLALMGGVICQTLAFAAPS